MIIPSKKEQDDSDPLEEPPSYDDVTRDSAFDHVPVASGNRKRPFLRPLSRTAPTPGPSTLRLPKPQSPVSSSPSSSSWFSRNVLSTSSSPKSARLPPEPSPTPRSQGDVRETVLRLIRDLVASSQSSLGVSLWSDGGVAAMGVLDSCVAVCARQQVSLASVLQELSIEGHTPAYWGIVQRPPSFKGHSDDVLMKLLNLSTPLTQHTIYDLRLACLVAYSNDILQRIRSSPSLFPFSGTDCVLLQGSDTVAPSRGFQDIIEVTEGADNKGGEGTFSVRMQLESFQRRMRVSKEVQVEFIARGRIWSLIFFIVPASLPHPYLYADDQKNTDTTSIPLAAYIALRMLPRALAPGSWACCLSLRAGSPECWVDGRIVVNEPDPATFRGTEGKKKEGPAMSMQARMQKPLPDPHASFMEPGQDVRGRHGHVRTNSTPDYYEQPDPSYSHLALPEFVAGSSSGRSTPGGSTQALTVPSSTHLSPPHQYQQHSLRPSPSTPSFLSTFSPSTFSSASSRLVSMSLDSWTSSASPFKKSKPPLTLRLKCVHGPLVAPPPPPYKALPLSLHPTSPLITNVLHGEDGRESKKLARRERKAAKKEAKARAAKEKRAREGKETKKEKVELGQEAHTVVVVGLGEGTEKDGKGGMGKLMYDGCPYIARDGVLRATFEAKLGRPESECIIC